MLLVHLRQCLIGCTSVKVRIVKVSQPDKVNLSKPNINVVSGLIGLG
jgi:hypothetical protein